MEAKTAAQIIPNAMALSSSKGNQPSQSSTSPRPTEKNPKSELPNSGTRLYVPPKQIRVGPNDIVKNPQGKGYLDNNNWKWTSMVDHTGMSSILMEAILTFSLL